MPKNPLPPLFLICLCLFLVSRSVYSNPEPTLPDWASLSMEEILQEEVSSISNYAEKRFESASAITLISEDQIREMGAWNYADIFRYVPGMQVAQVNAHESAISVRGNNSTFANDLLVLMDGRTLYNSIFSGVFWDAQHYLMEDLDHIEVIRGPGSTVWGSNAVNGVVSIQSKSAKDTLGSLIRIDYGTDYRSAAYRYGAQSGENLYYRIYWMGKEHFGTKGYEVGDTSLNLEQDYNDDWRHGQTGFRMDYELDEEKSFTLQGDIFKIYYDTEFRRSYQTASAPFRTIDLVQESTVGYNLLGHFKSGDDFDGFGIQAYYDYWEKDYTPTNGSHGNFDLSYNQFITLDDNQRITWGAGVRNYDIRVEDSDAIEVSENKQMNQVFSAFIQDTIPLFDEKVKITVGSKLEYLHDPDQDDFIEIQPSLRGSYKWNPNNMLWFGVSRSIQSPNFVNRYITRYENRNDYSDELPVPVQVIVDAKQNYKPVEIITIEAGNRHLLGEHWSFETSIFYRITDGDLTYVVKEQTPTKTLLDPANLRKKEAYGGDLTAGYKMNKDWELRFAYAYYNVRSKLTNGQVDIYSQAVGGEDPEHQWNLSSLYQFNDQWSLNTGLRYVSKLNLSIPPNTGLTAENYNVPDYVELDTSLHWKPREDWRITISGRNLLDNQKAEFANLEYASGKSESTRNVSLKAVYEF